MPFLHCPVGPSRRGDHAAVSGRGNEALVAAGWRPGRDAGNRALLGILETTSTVALDGVTAWQTFSAVEQALREFYGLTVAPAGPGVDVAATGCVVDPSLGRYALRTFAAFQEGLGHRLFPFGRTDAGALLAVDDKGRLFAVDHSGWWLLGESAGEGLASLAEGRAPWRVSSWSLEWGLARTAEGVVTDLVKTALVLAYLLHHHELLATRAIQARAVGFRGFGEVYLDREFRLRQKTLDANAEPLAEDIERALAPAPLDTAEVRLELLAAGSGPTRHAIGCQLAAGGQGVGGILVHLTARAGFMLDADRRRAVDDVTAEVERYAATR
ncbi:SUKH-3 domain-containing protein [Streptomyces sp. NPDC059474]|uniref:SUKH-3 domain-containing protein n=1 Tax=Streptomyces sp. NPDC059474 TaxID=3346846 RepID=UPI003685E417